MLLTISATLLVGVFDLTRLMFSQKLLSTIKKN